MFIYVFFGKFHLTALCLRWYALKGGQRLAEEEEYRGHLLAIVGVRTKQI